MTESAHTETTPSDATPSAPSGTAPSGSAPASAVDGLSAAYAQTESALSAASEKLVGSEAFADLLAFTTSNVLAGLRIANGAADSVVRNLRLAGRRDVARLGTQLARTEDKLERLLQEVRALRSSVEDSAVQDGPPPTARRATPAAAKAAGKRAPAAERAGRATAKKAVKKAATKSATKASTKVTR